jgi:hypothetical protein
MWLGRKSDLILRVIMQIDRRAYRCSFGTTFGLSESNLYVGKIIWTRNT